MSRTNQYDQASSPTRAQHLISLAARRTKRLDEAKLFILGYKQELKRELSFASNTGCTVLLASCFLLADLYSTLGLTYGGPVVMLWAWVVVTLALLCTAAVIAEMLSAFPTSGGLYYFTYILAPPRCRQFLCYLTGWMNVVAQIMCTTATELTYVTFQVTIISLHVSGPEEGPGWQPTKPQVVGIYAAALVTHAALSSIGQRVTSGILSLGFFWHMIAAPAFMVLLFVVAPVKQSTTWVFTEWIPNTEVHGITSPSLIAVMGVLMGQWLMVIFDSGVHLCEETANGDLVASWSVVSGVGISGVLGFAMLVTVNYCVQSLENLSDPESVTGGRALAQMVWDLFKARFGTGWGAMPLLYMALVPLFLSGPASLVANSRMVYAFSRDGAMLGSKHWRKVQSNGIPVNAVIMMASVSFLLGIYAIYDTQVNYAVYCMLVIGLNISLLIPIACRALHGSAGFIPGPFYLGKFGVPMSIVSCLWLTFTTVIFCLPATYPPTAKAFNASVVMLVSVLVVIALVWCIRGLRNDNWFSGPTPNIQSSNQDAATEQPLDVLAVNHALAAHSQPGEGQQDTHTAEHVIASARQSLAGFADAFVSGQLETVNGRGSVFMKTQTTNRTSKLKEEPVDEALKFAIDSYEDGRLEMMLMGQQSRPASRQQEDHPLSSSVLPKPHLPPPVLPNKRRKPSIRSASFSMAASTIQEGQVLGLDGLLQSRLPVLRTMHVNPQTSLMIHQGQTSADGRASSSAFTSNSVIRSSQATSHSHRSLGQRVQGVQGDQKSAAQPRSLALELSSAIASNARQGPSRISLDQLRSSRALFQRRGVEWSTDNGSINSSGLPPTPHLSSYRVSEQGVSETTGDQQVTNRWPTGGQNR